MIKLHFCKSNDLGGFLIRLFTFSRWNHVAIEIDGVVYESLTGRGVVKAPQADYWEWGEQETVEVFIKSPEKAKAFLDAQVGKQYDWLALLALPFHRNWHRPNRWFCSELVAEALVQGDSGFINGSLPSYRVTPKDLWAAVSWQRE